MHNAVLKKYCSGISTVQTGTDWNTVRAHICFHSLSKAAKAAEPKWGTHYYDWYYYCYYNGRIRLHRACESSADWDGCGQRMICSDVRFDWGHIKKRSLRPRHCFIWLKTRRQREASALHLMQLKHRARRLWQRRRVERSQRLQWRAQSGAERWQWESGGAVRANN